MKYRNLAQFSAFSDGVVAIAMTLMVLPLVYVAAEVRDHSVGQVLRENSADLLAFALSFYLVAFYWLVHHRAFDFLRNLDTVLINLNFLWLFSIVFLPVSTMVVAVGGKSPIAAPAFYLSNLLLISLVSFAMSLWISKHPDLCLPDVREAVASAVQRGGSVTVVMILALALTPLMGNSALFMLLLSPLATRVTKRIRGASAAP